MDIQLLLQIFKNYSKGRKMFIQKIINDSWEVTYDNFSWLLENKNYQNNKDFLDEDLLQIQSLDRKYIIDVGWYPSFDPLGHCTLTVIKEMNWDSPLFEYSTVNLEELLKEISDITTKREKTLY